MGHVGRNHGTAVLGELAAEQNNYGFTGIAPFARIGVCTWIRMSQVAGAIDEAASHLNPGDVLLIEVHLPGPQSAALWDSSSQFGYLPVEAFPDIAEVIRAAVAKGVVVVEAACNGQMDLDLLAYASRIVDTGAIMVGAADPGGLVPSSFTNSGSRVDLFAWAGSVSTLGFGDVAVAGDDQNQWYTMSFSGTSAASPIVAGAAALVNSTRKAAGLPVLNSRQMRDLLRRTGTPAGGDGSRQIGTMPNLRAALVAAGCNHRNRRHPPGGCSRRWHRCR